MYCYDGQVEFCRICVCGHCHLLPGADGTDYPTFLEEAHRVLKPHGLLWIAEV